MSVKDEIQDTGKFRKNTNDQFYTKELVAKECIQLIKDHIHNSESYQWIEPSAGKGSFIIDGCIALDIEPKKDNILKQDFLNYSILTDTKILIYGNPPFGKQSSLAKKFIKHASKFASVIAFILPRSFVKPSMNNVFPEDFHCLFTKELNKDSFEVNTQSYDVPCVFQIWEKKEEKRTKQATIQPNGFTYVKQTDSYDISIRRVGVNAGNALIKDKKVSAQSHYFIKLENVTTIENLIEKINKHIFPSNTVGPRSLSKNEINEVVNNFISL